jgi:hypothetical protein
MESQAKIEAMQQASQIKAQEASFKQQLSERDSQFQLMMSKAAADQEGRHKEMLAAIDIAIKTHTAKQQVAADNATFMQGLAHKQVDHTQKVQHAEQMATVQRKTAQQKGPTKK